MTTTVLLGTATPGGGFPLYGGAFAETINETDTSLNVEPRNTKGSTENIPLLEAGQLDIGLVTGEPAYEAWEGIGRPRSALTIITVMYSTAGMFVVRGDSAARTISDLKGKPVAFGAKGWTVYATARRPESIADLTQRGCRTLTLDVCDEGSMRAALATIEKDTGVVGVLINNAGTIVGGRRLTVDGYEYTFALDHLSPFLLTNLLLEKLKGSAPSRVITSR